MAMAFAAVIAAIAAIGTIAAPAGADALGEIASWGKPAALPLNPERPADEFFQTQSFGVDPVDGSIYVLDGYDGSVDIDPTSADEYRLQKFDSSGKELASALIPRPLGSAGAEETRPYMLGVAVDHAQGRVYLLQARKGADSGHSQSPVAEKLLVFSTDDSTGTLHAPAEIPSGAITLPDPEGEDTTLRYPAAITVDPATHDVLILARQLEPGLLEVAVIDRLSASGTAVERFVDSTGVMEENFDGGTRPAAGMVVSPDGQKVYVTSGSEGSQGRVRTYELPAAFEGATPEPLSAIKSKKFPAANTEPSARGRGGPNLAISPDGSTLYFGEEILDGESSPGQYLIRGISIADGSTKVLYGGGETSCRITRNFPGIGVDQEGNLFVLDRGDPQAAPPYGSKVLEFGAGGSGCPLPNPRFKLDGGDPNAQHLDVQQGDTVQFEADTSQLGTAIATGFEWDLDGSGIFATKLPVETTTVSRCYDEPETLTAALKVPLENSPVGELPPTTKTITVESVPPQAIFESLRSSEPEGEEVTTFKSGESVTFNAEESFDLDCSVEGRTHELQNYHWEFGDGTGEDTAEPVAEHSFANTAAGSVQRTVGLIVTSASAVKSAPFKQALTIEGTPQAGGGGNPPPPGGGSPPPPPPSGETKPQPKKTSNAAARRRKALAKCKKLKGRAKAKCIKKASKIGRNG